MAEIDTLLDDASLPPVAAIELQAAKADFQQTLDLFEAGDRPNSLISFNSGWQHLGNAAALGADLTALTVAVIDPAHEMAICRYDEAAVYSGVNAAIDRSLAYALGHLIDGEADENAGDNDKAIKHYLLSYGASDFAASLATDEFSASETSAQLAELKVRSTAESVQIAWTTAFEKNIAGFRRPAQPKQSMICRNMPPVTANFRRRKNSWK